ncbi:MAG: hypothetical protein Ct9H300mP9_3000 [Candidatus Neomarinimicrobiota bacterium]|nr:MAG: hypothetical protein Ct9H300mP9_3000 [Candidatus Neomarinimicrobiota bacterium]
MVRSGNISQLCARTVIVVTGTLEVSLMRNLGKLDRDIFFWNQGKTTKATIYKGPKRWWLGTDPEEIIIENVGFYKR